MKKGLLLFVSFILILCMAMPVFAAPVTDQGWIGDGNNTFGWDLEENGDISVDRIEDGTAHRIWKSNAVQDPDNWAISVDITIGGACDCYVKFMGIRVDLDARNGSGSQYIVKFLNEELKVWTDLSEWVEGKTATVVMQRQNGSDVEIIVTTPGGVFSAVTPVAKINEPNLEIGQEVEGWTARFENIVVASEPLATMPEPTEPAPTESEPTQPATIRPKPTQPAPTQPKPAQPAQDNTMGIALLVAGIAVVVVAVVVVLVLKKKKA